MWIKLEALLCCVIATSLAANEPRSKKKDDPRGKRNLEYNIAHHFNVPDYRVERRISTGFQIPQLPQYPLFFPIQKPFVAYRKGRPNLPAPPYAVQMEPLVHYSQRDPLYDANGVTFIGDGTNDIKIKEDFLKEHSHNSRSIYGQPEPTKQFIERPVYIKEPEPIIEIIIRESNTTLPPLPTPPVALTPRKKEQVQVFYVKYKKNPNGYGKDSVVYDKPVPAISPHIPDEPVQVEPPVAKYEAPAVTLPPPPSTTLRAIVKPDSESFHADKGIHITFGKQENEQYKRSNDDAKEESAPEPTLSHPQERQFPLQPQGRQFPSQDRQFPAQSSFFQKRPPGPPNHGFQSGPPTSFGNFKTETQRFPPQPYRTFNQPPPQFKPQQQQQQSPFGRQFPQAPQLQQHQQLPATRPTVNFQNPAFPPRVGPSFQQQLTGPQNAQFNQPIPPRQPVPYQPFDQLRPQQSQPSQQNQIQFPRTHTHFPIIQQPQISQQLQQQVAQQPQTQLHHQQQQVHQQPFNPQFNNEQQHLQATQQQFQHNLRHEELVRQQHQHQQQPLQQQQQFNHQQQQQPHPQQLQHQIHQQQFPQHQQRFPQQNIQQQHFGQQQQQQQFPQLQPERIIPPGGELIHSVPKFEQHISVPANPPQPQVLGLQQAQSQQTHSLQQQQNVHLNQQDFRQQIQQQFKQGIPDPRNQQQHNFASNLQVLQEQSKNPNIFIQQQQPSTTYQTTPKPIIQVSTTTYQTPTSTAEPSKPSSTTQVTLTEKDLKDLNIELPDEVPADLREQLLSSGILKNAQISVLDYDKVGDIPLSALPPDQLANFYGAGGGQQIAAAGSERIVAVVDKDGEPVNKDLIDEDVEMEGAESEVSEVKAETPVEMKVVHYDPKSDEGKQVQESYVQEGATQVDPVALNDQQYNRYLPVKVNGATFPIPDVPELKGRNISSVVILAPVSLTPPTRKTRDVTNKDPRHLAGEALKVLLKNPTTDNYKDWLDKENKTVADKQAVILLVTGDTNKTSTEKEIFMYDVATRTVSKLSGELSTAFVDAAETNSKQNIEAITGASSDVVETRVPYPEGSIDRRDVDVEAGKDLEDSASQYVETKIPVIDPTESDNLSSEASEQLESFVDISGIPIQPQGDLVIAASDSDALAKEISVSSGYSKTGSNLLSH